MASAHSRDISLSININRLQKKNNSMKKLVLVIRFGLVVSGAFAQAGTGTTYSFSLSQAVDFALQNQKDVKNAVLEEEVAQKKVNEIMGAGLPQVNSSFDLRKFFEGPTSVVDGSNFGYPPGSYRALSFQLPYNA